MRNSYNSSSSPWTIFPKLLNETRIPKTMESRLHYTWNTLSLDEKFLTSVEYLYYCTYIYCYKLHLIIALLPLTPTKICRRCRENDERPTGKNTTFWMGSNLPHLFLLSFLLSSWRAVRSYQPHLEVNDPIRGKYWSHSLSSDALLAGVCCGFPQL